MTHFLPDHRALATIVLHTLDVFQPSRAQRSRHIIVSVSGGLLVPLSSRRDVRQVPRIVSRRRRPLRDSLAALAAALRERKREREKKKNSLACAR